MVPEGSLRHHAYGCIQIRCPQLAMVWYIYMVRPHASDFTQYMEEKCCVTNGVHTGSVHRHWHSQQFLCPLGTQSNVLMPDIESRTNFITSQLKLHPSPGQTQDTSGSSLLTRLPCHNAWVRSSSSKHLDFERE